MVSCNPFRHDELNFFCVLSLSHHDRPVYISGPFSKTQSSRFFYLVRHHSCISALLMSENTICHHTLGTHQLSRLVNQSNACYVQVVENCICKDCPRISNMQDSLMFLSLVSSSKVLAPSLLGITGS
jgi:hypothetical protein